MTNKTGTWITWKQTHTHKTTTQEQVYHKLLETDPFCSRQHSLGSKTQTNKTKKQCPKKTVAWFEINRHHNAPFWKAAAGTCPSSQRCRCPARVLITSLTKSATAKNKPGSLSWCLHLTGPPEQSWERTGCCWATKRRTSWSKTLQRLDLRCHVFQIH